MFMDLMNGIFQHYLDSFVMVFIYDILIYYWDLKESGNRLCLVLSTLHEHKLYVKLKKCEFGLSEVKFLGHVIC